MTSVVENDLQIQCDLCQYSNDKLSQVHLETLHELKNNAADITEPNFKLNYQATVMKQAWCWQRNRYVDPGTE